MGRITPLPDCAASSPEIPPKRWESRLAMTSSFVMVAGRYWRPSSNSWLKPRTKWRVVSTDRMGDVAVLGRAIGVAGHQECHSGLREKLKGRACLLTSRHQVGAPRWRDSSSGQLRLAEPRPSFFTRPTLSLVLELLFGVDLIPREALPQNGAEDEDGTRLERSASG